MTPRSMHNNTEINFRIRLIVKGMFCGALMTGIAVWLAVKHGEYAATFGTGNTVLLGAALLLLPFFLLGLHRDITDSSWEGKIMEIEPCTSNSVAWIAFNTSPANNISPAKRTRPVHICSRTETHLRLRIRLDNGKIKTMVIPADCRSFCTGDHVVHFCGEKNGISHAEEK